MPKTSAPTVGKFSNFIAQITLKSDKILELICGKMAKLKAKLDCARAKSCILHAQMARTMLTESTSREIFASDRNKMYSKLVATN